MHAWLYEIAKYKIYSFMNNIFGVTIGEVRSSTSTMQIFSMCAASALIDPLITLIEIRLFLIISSLKIIRKEIT